MQCIDSPAIATAQLHHCCCITDQDKDNKWHICSGQGRSAFTRHTAVLQWMWVQLGSYFHLGFLGCCMGWASLRNPRTYISRKPPTFMAHFCQLLELGCHTCYTSFSSCWKPLNFSVSPDHRRKKLQVSSKGEDQNMLRAEPWQKTAMLVASGPWRANFIHKQALRMDSQLQWYLKTFLL